MPAKLYLQFNLALSFLTVFKLPEWRATPFDPRNLAACLFFFPLVGAILGGIALALVVFGTAHLGALPLAAWLVACWSGLTRGLHLDGLADCADGFGGAYEPAKRLLIMKDSRVGAFGVIALTLDLLLKTSLIAALIEQRQPGAMFIAPCLSRLAMVLCAVNSHYARAEGGLGQPFLDHLSRRHWLGASVLGLVPVILASGLQAIPQVLVLLLVVGLVRRLSRRALGGITGDVLGATNELAEIASLTCALWLNQSW